VPVLNKLSVRLEAQTRQFNRGIDKAKGKVKGFAKSNKSMGDVLGNVKGKLLGANPLLLGFGAAAVGAAVAVNKLVNQTAAYAESLQKMSIRLGVTTEDLSRFKFAAEQSGSSLQAIPGAFRKLAQSAFEARRGTLLYVEAFEKLGVKATDASGELRDVQDIFLDVADALKDTESATERLALAQSVLGRGATDLLPLLLEGSEGIKEFGKFTDEVGATIEKRFADLSASYVDRKGEISTALQGMGNTLSRQFLPTFNLVAEALSKWVAALARDFRKAFQEINFRTQQLLASITVGMLKIGKFLRVPGAEDALKGYQIVMNETREDLEKWVNVSDEAANSLAGVNEGLEGATAKTKTFAEVLSEVLIKMRGQGQTIAQLIEDAITLTEKQQEALKGMRRFGGAAPGEAAEGPGPEGPAAAVDPEAVISQMDIIRGEAQLLFDDLTDMASTWTDKLEGFARGFSTALVSAAKGAEGAFGQFFRNLLTQIAEAIVQAIILQSILSIFGGGPLGGSFFGGVGKILGGGLPAPGGGYGGGVQDIAGSVARGNQTNQGLSDLQVNLNATVNQATPMTWIEVTDQFIGPRLRERQDTLREAF